MGRGIVLQAAVVIAVAAVGLYLIAVSLDEAEGNKAYVGKYAEYEIHSSDEYRGTYRIEYTDSILKWLRVQKDYDIQKKGVLGIYTPYMKYTEKQWVNVGKLHDLGTKTDTVTIHTVFGEKEVDVYEKGGTEKYYVDAESGMVYRMTMDVRGNMFTFDLKGTNMIGPDA